MEDLELQECIKQCYGNHFCYSILYDETLKNRCVFYYYAGYNCTGETLVPTGDLKYENKPITLDCIKCPGNGDIISTTHTPIVGNVNIGNSVKGVSVDENNIKSNQNANIIDQTKQLGDSSISKNVDQTPNSSDNSSCILEFSLNFEDVGDEVVELFTDIIPNVEDEKECAKMCHNASCDYALYKPSTKICSYVSDYQEFIKNCTLKPLQNFVLGVMDSNNTDTVQLECIRCRENHIEDVKNMFNDKILHSNSKNDEGEWHSMTVDPGDAVTWPTNLQLSGHCVVVFQIDESEEKVKSLDFTSEVQLQTVEQCAAHCYKTSCSNAVFEFQEHGKGICKVSNSSSDVCSNDLQHHYRFYTTKTVAIQCIRCLAKKPSTKSPFASLHGSSEISTTTPTTETEKVDLSPEQQYESNEGGKSEAKVIISPDGNVDKGGEVQDEETLEEVGKTVKPPSSAPIDEEQVKSGVKPSVSIPSDNAHKAEDNSLKTTLAESKDATTEQPKTTKEFTTTISISNNNKSLEELTKEKDPYLRGCVVTFQVKPFSLDDEPQKGEPLMEYEFIAESVAICATKCYNNGCTGAIFNSDTQKCVLQLGKTILCDRGDVYNNYFPEKKNEKLRIFCLTCTPNNFNGFEGQIKSNIKTNESTRPKDMEVATITPPPVIENEVSTPFVKPGSVFDLTTESPQGEGEITTIKNQEVEETTIKSLSDGESTKPIENVPKSLPHATDNESKVSTNLEDNRETTLSFLINDEETTTLSPELNKEPVKTSTSNQNNEKDATTVSSENEKVQTTILPETSTNGLENKETISNAQTTISPDNEKEESGITTNSPEDKISQTSISPDSEKEKSELTTIIPEDKNDQTTGIPEGNKDLNSSSSENEKEDNELTTILPEEKKLQTTTALFEKEESEAITSISEDKNDQTTALPEAIKESASPSTDNEKSGLTTIAPENENIQSSTPPESEGEESGASTIISEEKSAQTTLSPEVPKEESGSITDAPTIEETTILKGLDHKNSDLKEDNLSTTLNPELGLEIGKNKETTLEVDTVQPTVFHGESGEKSSELVTNAPENEAVVTTNIIPKDIEDISTTLLIPVDFEVSTKSSFEGEDKEITTQSSVPKKETIVIENGEGSGEENENIGKASTKILIIGQPGDEETQTTEPEKSTVIPIIDSKQNTENLFPEEKETTSDTLTTLSSLNEGSATTPSSIDEVNIETTTLKIGEDFGKVKPTTISDNIESTTIKINEESPKLEGDLEKVKSTTISDNIESTTLKIGEESTKLQEEIEKIKPTTISENIETSTFTLPEMGLEISKQNGLHSENNKVTTTFEKTDITTIASESEKTDLTTLSSENKIIDATTPVPESDNLSKGQEETKSTFVDEKQIETTTFPREFEKGDEEGTVSLQSEKRPTIKPVQGVHDEDELTTISTKLENNVDTTTFPREFEKDDELTTPKSNVSNEKELGDKSTILPDVEKEGNGAITIALDGKNIETTVLPESDKKLSPLENEKEKSEMTTIISEDKISQSTTSKEIKKEGSEITTKIPESDNVETTVLPESKEKLPLLESDKDGIEAITSVPDNENVGTTLPESSKELSSLEKVEETTIIPDVKNSQTTVTLLEKEENGLTTNIKEEKNDRTTALPESIKESPPLENEGSDLTTIAPESEGSGATSNIPDAKNDQTTIAPESEGSGATTNIPDAKSGQTTMVPENEGSGATTNIPEVKNDQTTMAPESEGSGTTTNISDAKNGQTTMAPESEGSGATTNIPDAKGGQTTMAPENENEGSGATTNISEVKNDQTTMAPESEGSGTTTNISDAKNGQTKMAPESEGSGATTNIPDAKNDQTTIAPENEGSGATTNIPDVKNDQTTMPEGNKGSSPFENESDEITTISSEDKNFETTIASEDEKEGSGDTTNIPEKKNDQTTALPEEVKETSLLENGKLTTILSESKNLQTTTVPEEKEGSEATTIIPEDKNDQTTLLPDNSEKQQTTSHPEEAKESPSITTDNENEEIDNTTISPEGDNKIKTVDQEDKTDQTTISSEIIKESQLGSEATTIVPKINDDKEEKEATTIIPDNIQTTIIPENNQESSLGSLESNKEKSEATTIVSEEGNIKTTFMPDIISESTTSSSQLGEQDNNNKSVLPEGENKKNVTTTIPSSLSIPEEAKENLMTSLSPDEETPTTISTDSEEENKNISPILAFDKIGSKFKNKEGDHGKSSSASIEGDKNFQATTSIPEDDKLTTKSKNIPEGENNEEELIPTTIKPLESDKLDESTKGEQKTTTLKEKIDLENETIEPSTIPAGSEFIITTPMTENEDKMEVTTILSIDKEEATTKLSIVDFEITGQTKDNAFGEKGEIIETTARPEESQAITKSPQENEEDKIKESNEKEIIDNQEFVSNETNGLPEMGLEISRFRGISGNTPNKTEVTTIFPKTSLNIDETSTVTITTESDKDEKITTILSTDENKENSTPSSDKVEGSGLNITPSIENISSTTMKGDIEESSGEKEVTSIHEDISTILPELEGSGIVDVTTISPQEQTTIGEKIETKHAEELFPDDETIERIRVQSSTTTASSGISPSTTEAIGAAFITDKEDLTDENISSSTIPSDSNVKSQFNTDASTIEPKIDDKENKTLTSAETSSTTTAIPIEEQLFTIQPFKNLDSQSKKGNNKESTNNTFNGQENLINATNIPSIDSQEKNTKLIIQDTTSIPEINNEGSGEETGTQTTILPIVNESGKNETSSSTQNILESKIEKNDEDELSSTIPNNNNENFDSTTASIAAKNQEHLESTHIPIEISTNENLEATTIPIELKDKGQETTTILIESKNIEDEEESAPTTITSDSMEASETTIAPILSKIDDHPEDNVSTTKIIPENDKNISITTIEPKEMDEITTISPNGEDKIEGSGQEDSDVTKEPSIIPEAVDFDFSSKKSTSIKEDIETTTHSIAENEDEKTTLESSGEDDEKEGSLITTILPITKATFIKGEATTEETLLSGDLESINKSNDKTTIIVTDSTVKTIINETKNNEDFKEPIVPFKQENTTVNEEPISKEIVDSNEGKKHSGSDGPAFVTGEPDSSEISEESKTTTMKTSTEESIKKVSDENEGSEMTTLTIILPNKNETFDTTTIKTSNGEVEDLFPVEKKEEELDASKIDFTHTTFGEKSTDIEATTIAKVESLNDKSDIESTTSSLITEDDGSVIDTSILKKGKIDTIIPEETDVTLISANASTTVDIKNDEDSIVTTIKTSTAELEGEESKNDTTIAEPVDNSSSDSSTTTLSEENKTDKPIITTTEKSQHNETTANLPAFVTEKGELEVTTDSSTLSGTKTTSNIEDNIEKSTIKIDHEVNKNEEHLETTTVPFNEDTEFVAKENTKHIIDKTPTNKNIESNIQSTTPKFENSDDITTIKSESNTFETNIESTTPKSENNDNLTTIKSESNTFESNIQSTTPKSENSDNLTTIKFESNTFESNIESTTPKSESSDNLTTIKSESNTFESNIESTTLKSEEEQTSESKIPIHEDEFSTIKSDIEKSKTTIEPDVTHEPIKLETVHFDVETTTIGAEDKESIVTNNGKNDNENSDFGNVKGKETKKQENAESIDAASIDKNVDLPKTVGKVDSSHGSGFKQNVEASEEKSSDEDYESKAQNEDSHNEGDEKVTNEPPVAAVQDLVHTLSRTNDLDLLLRGASKQLVNIRKNAKCGAKTLRFAARVMKDFSQEYEVIQSVPSLYACLEACYIAGCKKAAFVPYPQPKCLMHYELGSTLTNSCSPSSIYQLTSHWHFSNPSEVIEILCLICDNDNDNSKEKLQIENVFNLLGENKRKGMEQQAFMTEVCHGAGRLEFQVKPVSKYPRLNITHDVPANSPAECAIKCKENGHCDLAGFVPSPHAKSSGLCLLTSDTHFCDFDDETYKHVPQHQSEVPFLIHCIRCSKCRYNLVPVIPGITEVIPFETAKTAQSIEECALQCSENKCTTAQFNPKSSTCSMTINPSFKNTCPSEKALQVDGNLQIRLHCVSCTTN
uniref:Apple domain-containing protein n=1 Tax=Parastrongyloides trichosuri TaxID=131310 RepID=A0A0N4ZCF1_PARTI